MNNAEEEKSHHQDTVNKPNTLIEEAPEPPQHRVVDVYSASDKLRQAKDEINKRAASKARHEAESLAAIQKVSQLASHSQPKQTTHTNPKNQSIFF